MRSCKVSLFTLLINIDYTLNELIARGLAPFSFKKGQRNTGLAGRASGNEPERVRQSREEPAGLAVWSGGKAFPS